MGNKGKKLLERARNSPHNWKKDDLVTLYLGFGFTFENGSKHDIVKSMQHPEIRATVPRHNTVNSVYVNIAVQLIDKLLELESRQNECGTNGTSKQIS